MVQDVQCEVQPFGFGSWRGVCGVRDCSQGVCVLCSQRDEHPEVLVALRLGIWSPDLRFSGFSLFS
jgi:hypothetical protein